MATLLRIDSSPLFGHSISRHLTSTFLDSWKTAHPAGTVVHRDLNATEIPPIDANWIGAAFTPEDSQTPEQKQLLALSDLFIDELQNADEIVIGVPMHNFSIPSVLKLWIDQVVRVGKTFSYAGGTPNGLITGKKATCIIATGGIYDPQTQMASFNFTEPYLRTVLGFIGITDIKFITAGGTSALRHGGDRETFLAPHVKTVQTHVQAL